MGMKHFLKIIICFVALAGSAFAGDDEKIEALAKSYAMLAVGQKTCNFAYDSDKFLEQMNKYTEQENSNFLDLWKQKFDIWAQRADKMQGGLKKSYCYLVEQDAIEKGLLKK